MTRGLTEKVAVGLLEAERRRRRTPKMTWQVRGDHWLGVNEGGLVYRVDREGGVLRQLGAEWRAVSTIVSIDVLEDYLKWYHSAAGREADETLVLA